MKERIKTDLSTAIKEKNAKARDVLRVLKGEVERAEQGPNGRIDLSDADIIKIVKRMIEGIKETTNDLEEIVVLDAYMPKQMDLTDVKTNVQAIKTELNAIGMKDMGRLMKEFNSRYPGMVDGKELSNIVKEVLA